jgi:signal transduction histidine kinase/ActR/RegA family two-component response regulator
MDLSSEPSSSGGRGAMTLAVTFVLAVGWTLTAAVVFNSRSQALESGRVRFERLTERMVDEVQRRVNLPLYGLNGITGLYAASSNVERHEFRTFVTRHDLAQEFPGVLAFGIVERVPRAKLDEFVRRERKDVPSFRVRTRGDAPDLFPIKFLEPLVSNEAALGYDIGSEPVRRATVERAMRTGRPALTQAIHLVQHAERNVGFLYLVPIYRNGTKLRTPAEREAALVGLAYAPLLVDRVFDGLEQAGTELLDLDVFDGPVASTSMQMIDTGNDESVADDAALAAQYAERIFHAERHVTIGGREWTLVLTSTPHFEATIETANAYLFGATGFVVSLLLAMMLWTLGTARDRALGLAREMTIDLETARLRADAASRAKSEFLANMSHEIRTPLTAIVGYADVLRDEGEADWPLERRRQTLDTICAAGRHLLTVVNDLLDLSKIEVGRMNIETVETPLLRMLCEIESLMRPRATEKGLAIATRLAGAVPDRVMSDPTRLRQILINLVGNAVKFTDRGSISIEAHSVERGGAERLVIDVEDTGPGIDPERATRLFAAFAQGDASVTRRFGGTGLGLALCYRFADLLGGSVSLARTELGRGSCFRVDLPLVPAPGAVPSTSLEAVVPKPAPAPPASAITLHGRILVAEDSEDNLRLISFHLRKAGAEVESAENGRVALAMLEKAEREDHPYDLLLTDMQMPEMDGYTLARTLRERGSRIAIVALTAHAMAEDRQQCIKAGCDDYATKPIDRQDLLARCARWMGGIGGSAPSE